MSQMKEQDKTPEEQLSEVEIAKRIQNNDSEDDPRSGKKNGGGIDWEFRINIYTLLYLK